MLSVDAIIQSQGSKIGWDRPFSGNEFMPLDTLFAKLRIAAIVHNLS